MRASAQWCRRLSERFAPREVRRGVVHLRNYASEFLVAGDGEPLVIVPGLAGGFELLGRLVRVLAEQFRVICFQLRGERAWPPAPAVTRLADMADDLADFEDALVLERPAVVGVSFGAAVALEFAIRHARRSGPLVLQGAPPCFRKSLGGQVARLALEQFPLPHDNPFFNQFFRMLFARREAVGRLFDFVVERCWRTDQSVIARRLRLLADFDVRDRASSIRVPTLVVAGADDSIVRPNEQQALAELIGDCRFASIGAAGHLCSLTRPRAFARHVSAFLGSLRPAALRLAA